MLGKALAAAAKAVEPAYVEDVFQTWLYTGNGSTQTITNGIDLAGKGGLVWIKSRGAANHALYDTERGSQKILSTSLTAAQDVVSGQGVTGFTGSGFTLGSSYYAENTNGQAAASWTFRKQAKFFDVVTFNYTSGSIRVPHSLGSVPGCIIVKYVGGNSDWYVYHRSRGRNYYSRLNQTSAEINVSDVWDTTDPTSTDFGMSNYLLTAGTWVAYVFAHDAGGFGASGSDSVVKCGSYTGNGSTSGPTITLGWEPQWLLVKRTDSVNSWWMLDTMRGLPIGSGAAYLLANLNSAEASFGNNLIALTATGFQLITDNSNFNSNGSPYIYIAIRRGPMKTPTDATKVFKANTYTGNGSQLSITGTGFPPDFSFTTRTDSASWVTTDKLRGAPKSLYAQSTSAEIDNGIYEVLSYDQNGITYGQNSVVNGSSSPHLNYLFRRAPGFFDAVCYTLATNGPVPHNLGVIPELIIYKTRNISDNWIVYSAPLGINSVLKLNTTAAAGTDGTDYWTTTAPTSTNIYAGSFLTAFNYIAYLFASCPGVSKVGSYTGTGTTLSIDCGFTNGARFVLIKRTDSTGDWYVWDTARGIVSGNDPYLLLNSTAAEVTNTDYIDPLSSGFQISSTAPAAINANGGSFIYLAIA